MIARSAHRAGAAVLTAALAAAGLVPLAGTVLVAPAAASPEVSGVVVNEVSQRVNPDWVELYNTSDEAVDLTGWKLQDDQDRGPEDYVFPDGSLIGAGDYLVIDAAEGDVPGFGFGLGAADIVRLSDTTGTLADSLEWAEHAATTWGRCPDGTGAVRLTAGASRGEANDCTSPARINEVGDGFIELVNPTDSALELGGHVVRATGAEDGYEVPAGTVEAGEFLLIEAEALGFEPAEADGVELVDGAGTVADEHGWGTLPEPSTGRCPDGIGAFAVTASATPGAANDCVPVAGQDDVKVNEVESDEGDPGDWIEFVNIGAEPVDVSGWLVRDNDDTRFSTIPAGTVIPAGGFYVHEEAVLGFGLGGGDMARLYTPNGTLADSYTWEEHAATTYGRCPDGTGEFTTTTSSTKGAANDCGPAVRINEVESSGGDPGDWVELANPSGAGVDIAGWEVRDNDDTHVWTAPAGTVVPAGGYLVVEEADLGYGLGGEDSVRLFATGDTEPVDSYTWTEHAPTTYGRCPDSTGEFAATVEPSKGAANVCEGDPAETAPWPGGPDVTIADEADTFDGDLSGIDYAPTGTADAGVLWAVDNGRGQLHKLEWDGTVWQNSTDEGWSAGKLLHYPDGTGAPDSEGVTVTGDGSVVVGAERDNDADDASKLSLLRFDVTSTDAELSATAEWDLTAGLPAAGPNAGIEAVEWVADDVLTELGFVDESTGEAYDPAGYEGHDGGVYFVGIEGTGLVYAYVLLDGGEAHRLATIDPELAGVMALDFDLATNTLWVVCDNGCTGTSAQLRVDDTGAFAVAGQVAPPAAIADLNTEGFAITPVERCVDGFRPVYWTDDEDTGEHSLRAGTLPCPDPGEPGDDDGSDTGTDGGDGGSLPDTGGVATYLVAGGVLLTLAGFGLVIADRRRRGRLGPS